MDEDLVRRCYLDLYKYLSTDLDAGDQRGKATYALKQLRALPETGDDAVNMLVATTIREFQVVETFQQDQRDFPELGNFFPDDVAGVVVSYLRTTPDYTMVGFIYIMQELMFPMIGFYFSIDAQLQNTPLDDWLFEHDQEALELIILDAHING